MDNKITITICGDGGCGKSSITLRIVRGQWTHEYDPTIEDSYSITRTVDGTTYNLAITDTAGQEEYRGMWSTSAAMSSDAFLLVYDITSPASLEQCSEFDQAIQIEFQNRLEEGTQCWPALMVVGNKCDLASSRELSAKEGLDWARARGYGFMETSAREMVNVEETITALVRRVVQARTRHAEGQKPDMAVPSSPVVRIDTPASPAVNDFDDNEKAPVEDDGTRSRAESPHLWTKPTRGPVGKMDKLKVWWSKVKCW